MIQNYQGISCLEHMMVKHHSSIEGSNARTLEIVLHRTGSFQVILNSPHSTYFSLESFLSPFPHQVAFDINYSQRNSILLDFEDSSLLLLLCNQAYQQLFERFCYLLFARLRKQSTFGSRISMYGTACQ